MSYIAIPLAVLEAPSYLALSPADQKFLIDLYVTFHDCQRFTIDMSDPAQYRQSAGVTLQRKVRNLLAAGLLQVTGTTGKVSHERRVFTFTHPALNAELETA